jgi:hypothetical protein
MRWAREFRLHAAVLAVIGCVLLPASASASTTGSCVRASSTSSHYNCQFWPAGNGISAGALVVNASGDKLGYLNHGTNWVTCQQAGSENGSSATHNKWWAWTEANDQKVGWVSALYAAGGANDEPYYGVPNCAGAHGSAPIASAGGGPAPPTTPPTTPPTAPAPSTPEPCSVHHRRHYCSFYPAGDGIHGGTPVVNNSGHWVGYLNHGSNWIDCQLYGGKVTHSSDYNHYWGWTEANDHHWGWVNAVWANGGSNDGKFAGIPSCDNQRESAPPGQITSGPTKPKPPKHTPKPPPKPTTHDCGDLQQNQSATVQWRVHVENYRTIGTPPEGQAPLRQYVIPPATREIGSLHIGAATCRGPHGYFVVSPIQVNFHSDGLYGDANDELQPRGNQYINGWGVALEKAHAGRLDMHGLYCTAHKTDYGILNIIGAIPIPYAHYAVSLLQWGVTSFVHLKSESHKCGDVGTDQIRVSAASNGKLRVTAPQSGLQMGGIETDVDQSAGGERIDVYNQRNVGEPIITYGN